ncbi:MAG: bifunctional DNA-formamidopyrimidine glycosylase/DNA-(apurinic or apyrimidinic site) lyase [Kofleriaceae bacterium]
MPELPEVESVRRGLVRRRLRGATIARVRSSGLPLRLARPQPLAALRRAARGSVITDVRRIGKYLLIDLDRRHAILVHLGMSGNLFVARRSEPWAPHTHVVFELADGRDLRFVDPRRFGMVEVVDRERPRLHPALAALGPDPITDGLTAEHLLAAAGTRTTATKLFILDQAVIAGVGNIYASEALWLAGIAPTRPAGQLGLDGARAVAIAVTDVLAFAIDNGGTTLRDFLGAGGVPGENGEFLLVYGRAGHPCARCATAIRKSVQGGRATYFCPTCQRR